MMACTFGPKLPDGVPMRQGRAGRFAALGTTGRVQFDSPNVVFDLNFNNFMDKRRADQVTDRENLTAMLAVVRRASVDLINGF